MKQDKYGIYVPDHTQIALGHDRKENVTRIYTTVNGNPMVKSEVEQCLKLYQKEMGLAAKTIVIPTTLKEYITDMEKLDVVVKIGAARPNQITLSQN